MPCKSAAATLALALAATLTPSSALAASSHVCSLDSHPGATLLLPYFEVDVDDPAGVTTMLSIHNARAQNTLARVVLWTDLAVPTFGFDVYLTGYDVQSLNLRDVFAGHLPATGPDTSPVGPLSEPTTSTGCDRPPPEVPVDFLRATHSGRPTADGLCAALPSPDGHVRGYATIDVANRCSDLLPIDEGYFGGGFEGVAGFANVLWGDAFYITPGENNARGDRLVTLQVGDRPLGAGDLTFYGRYTGGDASDRREPLPTIWAGRHLTGTALDARSTLTVWRDVGSAAQPFPCDTAPAWFPRSHVAAFAFDEQENTVLLDDANAFPAATQRVELEGPFAFGVSHLDLNPGPYSRAQSYVAGTVSADGRFSIDRPATPLDTGCDLAGCTFGRATAVGKLCVVNTDPFASGIAVGDAVRFQVFPSGCFSSSCTRVFRAACELSRGAPEFELEAEFCIEDTIVPGPCTADCAGGGFASCGTDEPLGAGTYTVTAGGLTLEFEVPTDIPFGGLCVERDF